MSKKILELDNSNKNSREYEVKVIQDNAVYANDLESGHLPSFYYLVAWKGYSEKKNT